MPQTSALSNQKAGIGLIVAGYIFAFLGGLIGVAIGAQLWMGKLTDSSGAKVAKYETASRNHGLAILVIGVTSMLFWGILNAALGG